MKEQKVCLSINERKAVIELRLAAIKHDKKEAERKRSALDKQLSKISETETWLKRQAVRLNETYDHEWFKKTLLPRLFSIERLVFDVLDFENMVDPVPQLNSGENSKGERTKKDEKEEKEKEKDKREKKKTLYVPAEWRMTWRNREKKRAKTLEKNRQWAFFEYGEWCFNISCSYELDESFAKKEKDEGDTVPTCCFAETFSFPQTFSQEEIPLVGNVQNHSQKAKAKGKGKVKNVDRFSISYRCCDVAMDSDPTWKKKKKSLEKNGIKSENGKAEEEEKEEKKEKDDTKNPKVLSATKIDPFFSTDNDNKAENALPLFLIPPLFDYRARSLFSDDQEEPRDFINTIQMVEQIIGNSSEEPIFSSSSSSSPTSSTSSTSSWNEWDERLIFGILLCYCWSINILPL